MQRGCAPLHAPCVERTIVGRLERNETRRPLCHSRGACHLDARPSEAMNHPLPEFQALYDLAERCLVVVSAN